jgi:hypothetical protein
VGHNFVYPVPFSAIDNGASYDVYRSVWTNKLFESELGALGWEELLLFSFSREGLDCKVIKFATN